MSDSLMNRLLAVPTSKDKPKRKPKDSDFTSQIEVTDSSVNITLNDEVGAVNEGTALSYLEQEGLNPSEWEVSSFRKSAWGDPDNLKESVAFTFKRATVATEVDHADIEELVSVLDATKRVDYDSVALRDTAMVVVIGDMQFGKYENPTEECLQRTMSVIDKAAEQAFLECPHHIHVAWMGDHIEGFVSQGGANTWRTTLTLTEQTRLVRHVMRYAMQRFTPLCERLTMAAVPGNHGEPQRFQGKGITRYDDSHDTEALIAVSEAASLSREYTDVEFYVPESDEMTVLLEVGGMYFAHAHGHQWRPNKHFEWWKGQSFSKKSSMHMADVLLAGHLHHSHIEEDGKRLYVGAPALEAESTWFRHSTGSTGNPGVLALTVANQEVERITRIFPEEVGG